MEARDPDKIWGFEEQGQPVDVPGDPLLKFQPAFESYALQPYDASKFAESWQVIKPVLSNLIEIRKRVNDPGALIISRAILRSMNYIGMFIRRLPEERLSASVIALEASIMPFDDKGGSRKRVRFAQAFKGLVSRRWQNLKRRPTHAELKSLTEKGEAFYDRRSVMVHQADVTYASDVSSPHDEQAILLSHDLRLMSEALVQGLFEVSDWTLRTLHENKAISSEALERYLQR